MLIAAMCALYCSTAFHNNVNSKWELAFSVRYDHEMNLFNRLYAIIGACAMFATMQGR